MLTLRVPDDVVSHVEPLAQTIGKSAKDYIHEAFFEFLQDMQDAHIAAQRLKDIRSGKTKPIPLEEVMKEHGMEN